MAYQEYQKTLQDDVRNMSEAKRVERSKQQILSNEKTVDVEISDDLDQDLIKYVKG